MYASTIASGSYTSACLRAGARLSHVSTRETPIDEPWRAGFTTTGNPKGNQDGSALSASPSVTTRYGARGIPWKAKTFLDMILSIPRAEARTPDPV